jgi:uncharacterized protein YuzE
MALTAYHDPESDAVELRFTSTPAIDGEEVAPDVVLHRDADGHLVAVEILHASRVLAAEALAGLPILTDQPVK